MSISLLLVPNPHSTPFYRWANFLLDALVSYNVPNPPEEEALWQPWALDVFAIPEIAELGVGDPRRFGSWQDWGLTFLQVSN